MSKYLPILLFIPLNLFSYTLYPVGEVESRQWNDTWEEFYDYPLTIHAGTSEDTTQKAIRLTIKNSFGDDYVKTYRFNKCSKKQLERKRCDEDGFLITNDQKDLEVIKSILRKSIEWSEIAIENEVERISKNIELDGKDVWSPFGGGKVSFFASLSTRQTELIMPAYFHLVDYKDRYYSLDAQKKFLFLLENEVDIVLKKSLKNLKEEDLFK